MAIIRVKRQEQLALFWRKADDHMNWAAACCWSGFCAVAKIDKEFLQSGETGEFRMTITPVGRSKK